MRRLNEAKRELITLLRSNLVASREASTYSHKQLQRAETNIANATLGLVHAASTCQSCQGIQLAFVTYRQPLIRLQKQLAGNTLWKRGAVAQLATSVLPASKQKAAVLYPPSRLTGILWQTSEGKLAPRVAKEVAVTLQFWRVYCNYLLSFETANLPAWTRARLLDIACGKPPSSAWLEQLSGMATPRVGLEANQLSGSCRHCTCIHNHGRTRSAADANIYCRGAAQEQLCLHSQGPSNFAMAPQAEVARAQLSWLGRLWWSVCEAVLDACRLTHLLIIFLPLLTLSPIMLSHPRWRRRWLRHFRMALERAGTAFIKWGQWAATRRDLFPPDLCQELEHLHACAPVHTLSLTQAAIRGAFGAAYDEVFDDFPAEPIASGSIGQVYRARLSAKGARHTGIDPGTLVAVKVRHPGVGKSIQRDFALMMRVAQLAAWIPYTSGVRLEDPLKQFAGPLREQVDLSLEARHLWAFNYNFRFNNDVRFPFPIYPLVAPEVLVETFAEGDCISDYVNRGAEGEFNSRLARMGSQTMLQMMLVDNLIHSDLHPGNILVSLDPPTSPLLHLAAQCMQRLAPDGYSIPSHWRQPRLVLLDAGMATHLSAGDQENMLHLFQAFSDQDGARMAAATLAFSSEEQTCPDTEGFIQDVDTRFNIIQAAQQRGEIRDGAEALGSLLELVRQHQVSLPGHICAVVVTTLVLEGWSSQLDPSHAVLSQVQQLLAKKTSFTNRLVSAVGESFRLL